MRIDNRGAHFETEFNDLNTRFTERGERAKEARDAFLTKLAETSSTDPKMTQFIARVHIAVWHEKDRDGLTWLSKQLLSRTKTTSI